MCGKSKARGYSADMDATTVSSGVRLYFCFAKNRSDPFGCASADDGLLTSSQLV
jgi:hypothetical protein